MSLDLKYYKLALDETSSVIVLDENGFINDVNDRACAISKFSKAELIGQNVRMITSVAYADDFFQEINNAIHSGTIWKGEIKNETKDGSPYWMDSTIVPFLDENRNLLQSVVIQLDITDKKRLEQELIETKNVSKKALLAKDTFLTNVSHEIRTPMNAVVGFAELLAETNLNVVQQEFVSNIQTSGDRLMRIINDILDLSEMKKDRRKIKWLPFDLRNNLKQAYSLLKAKAMERNLEFNLFLDIDLPEKVGGDAEKLNQILVNLIENAIKFTEKGTVTVSVKVIEETDEKYKLRFSVSDTGIGIPKEKLSDVFEYFSQVDDSVTRRFGGTGLGLSIVKKNVELMQGEVQVSSQLGGGSDFFVLLDFEKEMNPALGEAIAIPKIANQFEKTTVNKVEKATEVETEIAVKPVTVDKKISVLLCEDNILNQHLIKNIIRKFGYKLDIANNGQEGITLLEQNQYDVILMDIQMPIKDGYETAIHIRKELKLDVPIIAMTANFLEGEQQKCLEKGMNSYLSKPFKQQDLHEKIIELVKITTEKQQIIPERAIDFSYLEEFSGGDMLFKNEMINLFLNGIPSDLKELESAIQIEDFAEAKKSAHHMKSSLSMFCLTEELTQANLIEREAETATSMDQIKNLYTNLKIDLQSVISILQKKQLVTN
jgi:PAS domain S-box-containing protein